MYNHRHHSLEHEKTGKSGSLGSPLVWTWRSLRGPSVLRGPFIYHECHPLTAALSPRASKARKNRVKRSTQKKRKEGYSQTLLWMHIWLYDPFTSCAVQLFTAEEAPSLFSRIAPQFGFCRVVPVDLSTKEAKELLSLDSIDVRLLMVKCFFPQTVVLCGFWKHQSVCFLGWLSGVAFESTNMLLSPDRSYV